MKRFDKEQTRKLFEHLISNLDFVKKNTYDEILSKLAEFYEKYKKIN
jgi:hypothetical protein